MILMADWRQHAHLWSIWLGVLYYFLIRQVNGVKLIDILFYLRFRPSVWPCALIFRCKYLENGLRQMLGTNCPLIGNGLWWIEWWRHWWRHMTIKGQGRDPNIFKARYFENGSRERLGFNGARSPSPTLYKNCKKIHLAGIWVVCDLKL